MREKKIDTTKKKINTTEITIIGLMTAVLCILGPLTIPIPISVVPISFTNLAIYIIVYVLGWKKGTITYLLYFIIGLAGVPVFSGFGAGLSKLAGPTGGYLIGFIFMTMFAGFMVEKFPGKKLMHLIGMVVGLMIAYTLGTVWLAYQLDVTIKAGIFMAVVPYLPGDALKIAAALMVGPVLQKNLKNVIHI